MTTAETKFLEKMNIELPSTQNLFNFSYSHVPDNKDSSSLQLVDTMRNKNYYHDYSSSQVIDLKSWDKDYTQPNSNSEESYFSGSSFPQNGFYSYQDKPINSLVNSFCDLSWPEKSDKQNSEVPLVYQRSRHFPVKLSQNYSADNSTAIMASDHIDSVSRNSRIHQLRQQWENAERFVEIMDENNQKLDFQQKKDQHINILKSVDVVSFRYRKIFDKFPFFNVVQSTVFDDVYNTDKPLVVSAPTGSGKTVILELAIVRLLMEIEKEYGEIRKKNDLPKIIYMAPLKALVGEKYLDWNEKFAKFGLACSEITGDTFHDDFDTFKNSQIILTTPEKWDSLTRRWRDNETLMKSVFLVLIDEVHVLSEEMRGPTIEAVVSRMRTVQAVYHEGKLSLRIIAVSATIPNAEDVAHWLSTEDNKAAYFKFDESLRPVQLQKIVLGFTCRDSWSDFRFDLSLNYKVASVICTYSENRPTLVFTSTRKGAVQTALVLMKEGRFVRNSEHKELLTQVANGLRDSKLRECVLYGVGYHHAGIEVADRRNLESLFVNGNLPVLVSTTTLAMGVNLPAHLVIIKSTSQYINGSYKEYSASQVLQMVGRAGRPQFDDHATAVIMTKSYMKNKYENLVTGKDVLESHLHKHLIEHVNAEIVLGTIQDENVAVEWLKSTYLYVRVQKNPRHYGLQTNLTVEQLEQKLQEMCAREVTALASVNLIERSGTSVKPTYAGRLMSRYCVSFPTMKSFLKMNGDESLKELLEIISNCEEFADIKIRTSDKRILNEMNKTVLRFPIKGKVKTRANKVSCLIQSTLSCSNIGDFGLTQESTKVFRTGQRLTKCLFEYAFTRKEYELLLNAVILTKVFSSHLWETSKHVARQLDRIGPALANALVNSKINSFSAIENTDPRDIEMICNRNPPFGNRLREQTLRLPRYELTVEQLGQVQRDFSRVKVTLSLTNANELLSNKSTTPKNHSSLLLLGNSDNSIIFVQRITDASLLKCEGTIVKEVTVKRSPEGDDIYINFVSETWVGLDVQSVYTPRYLGPGRPTDVTKLSVGLSDRKEGNCNSRENASKNAGTGTKAATSRRSCLHSCIDKKACKHHCCKFGITSKHPVKEVLRKVSLMPDPVPSVKRLKLPNILKPKGRETHSTVNSSPVVLSCFNFTSSKQKFQFSSVQNKFATPGSTTETTNAPCIIISPDLTDGKKNIDLGEDFCVDVDDDEFFNAVPINDPAIVINDDDVTDDINGNDENSAPSFSLLEDDTTAVKAATPPDGMLTSRNIFTHSTVRGLLNATNSCRVAKTEELQSNSCAAAVRDFSAHSSAAVKRDACPLAYTLQKKVKSGILASPLMVKLAQLPGASTDVANRSDVKEYLGLLQHDNGAKINTPYIDNKHSKPVAGVKPIVNSVLIKRKPLSIASSVVQNNFANQISVGQSKDWNDLELFQKYRQMERNALSSLYSTCKSDSYSANHQASPSPFDNIHSQSSLPRSNVTGKSFSNPCDSTLPYFAQNLIYHPQNFSPGINDDDSSFTGSRQQRQQGFCDTISNYTDVDSQIHNITDRVVNSYPTISMPNEILLDSIRRPSQRVNIDITGLSQDIRINLQNHNGSYFGNEEQHKKMGFEGRLVGSNDAASLKDQRTPKGILKCISAASSRHSEAQDLFEGII